MPSRTIFIQEAHTQFEKKTSSKEATGNGPRRIGAGVRSRVTFTSKRANANDFRIKAFGVLAGSVILSKSSQWLGVEEACVQEGESWLKGAESAKIRRALDILAGQDR